MGESTVEQLACPGESRDVLTELCRDGARQMLMRALEAEVAGYLATHEREVDARGRRQVVRNGYLPERSIQTGLGELKVRQPRVADRRVGPEGSRFRFTSAILPPYLRRTRQVEDLVPWLYLKGISTGDFSEALSALFGADARGLSANTVTRLKAGWAQDYTAWSRRSLSGKRYVYMWVDGVYFNVRLESERSCILVVMGATAEGRKELVAVEDGVRESEQSWKDLLLDLKRRGLEHGPDLAIGDGSLGFWKALPQVFGRSRAQRCWVHKTANVLNYLPKGLQSLAKSRLHEIWMAATRAEANKAFDSFLEAYGAKYPKAAECLRKDRDELLAFYDFPAEHWIHIRTTNPIESTFATVRLRTAKTKGCGTRLATLSMVCKLCQSAEKHWRTLNGSQWLRDVIQGVQFKDGIKVAA